MRKLLPALAFLALSVFWACHLNEGENEDHFDLIGDTSWVSCDEVTVVLLDKDGKEIDVLFKGPLKSVDELKGLSAAKYDGTTASIHVSGLKDGKVCFDEKRTFDGDGSNLKVDTVVSPTAKPTAVVVEPDSISIPLGGAGVPVKATVKPSYVNQGVEWRIAGDGVVSLTLPTGEDQSQVKINPAKIGSTEVLVISRKDSSITGRLKVTVTAPSGFGVEIDQDSVVAYIGGGTEKLTAKVKPETADQKVVWSSLEPNVASIDTQGNVKGLREGETYVVARSIANNVYASTHVQVKRDAPKLTVASKSGAPVNAPITFSPRSVQQYGVLVMFKWDLDGDGAYEDSTADSWPGKEVDLPPLTAKYAKEGQVIAKFLVRDGEGNESVAQVTLDIGNQAPEFLALSNDTSVSINDSVPFKAFVRDVDGKVAWVGWDYDNDGSFDDSITPSADSVKSLSSHKYPDAGFYRAVIKAKDETGKARLDTVIVKVELDRPKAQAGNDTTVTVGAKVPVHVGGTDKYGKIEKREVRLHGSGTGFLLLSKEDTVFTAPNEPGAYMVVVRVTDDDGLVDLDSLTVTVVLSANADLSNLVFSGGPLDPAFKPAISLFTAQVAYDISSVTVTPTAKDPEAKITVNAKPVASGSPSEAVKLVVGSNPNVFAIIVTAADGTQRYFSVSVARNPSVDASLSKLDVTGFVLKPAFAATTLDYADTVSSMVSSVTLKPTLAVPTSSLTVNDSAMASGTATYPLPLAIGENTFKLVVTSQSGDIKTTYTAKVFRRVRLFTLRSLDGKPGTQIDSTESIPGTSRPLSSDPVTGYHFVKWTLLEGSAAIKDSLSNPTEITLNSALVRAQANFAINTYTLTAGAGKGGSISPSGLVPVIHGADAAFKVTVDAGFKLKSLIVDGADSTASLVGGVYTFKAVKANHSINANYLAIDTVYFNVGPGGAIVPAPVGNKIILPEGSDTAFTVSPVSGSKISVFKVDGVDRINDLVANKFSFKAIVGNHNVEVAFQKGWTLLGVAGVGGSIDPTSVGVDEGASQTFTVKPDSNYRVNTFLDNGKDVLASLVANQYTLNKIDTAHTITVTFKKRLTVTVATSGNGTGKVDPGTTVVDEGQSLAIKYEALPGSKVTSVTLDGVAQTINGTVQLNGISANRTVAIVFGKTYRIDVTWGGNGTVAPGPVDIDEGKNASFNLTPASGLYRVDSIKVDGVAQAITNPFVIANVTAPHALRVHFVRTFNVTASGTAGGSVTPGSAVVDSLLSHTLTVKADPDAKLTALLDNGKDVLASVVADQYTLDKVDADHAVTATFKKRFTVTVNVTGNGVGKVDPGTTVVNEGDGLKIGYEAGANSKVTSVTLDGVPQTITGSVSLANISANMTVAIVFGKTYRITVEPVGNGTVTPGTTDIDEGKDASFTLTPASPLYRVDSVKVDGAAQAIASPFTIPAVNAPHTLRVHFVRTFNVAAGVALGVGTITPTSAVVDSLLPQTFTVSPGDHHRLWMVTEEDKPMVTDSLATQYVTSGITSNRLTTKAYFWRKFDLTVKAGLAGGKISFSSAALLDSNSMPEITITPDAGYRIESITDNGVVTAGSGDPYVSQKLSLKPIKSNHEFFATFKRYYTLTAESNNKDMGVIVPSSINVDEGGSAEFTIKPTTGFHLSALVDGKAGIWPNITTYTVSSVTSNHQIFATFSNSKTAQITLAFSVPGVPSRDGLITSSKAELCLVASNGAEICQKGGYSMNVEYGEILQIWAYSDYVTVSDCSGIVCSNKEKSFTQWNLYNADGKPVLYTEKQIITEFKVDNNYSLQAIYNTDGIIK